MIKLRSTPLVALRNALRNFFNSSHLYDCLFFLKRDVKYNALNIYYIDFVYNYPPFIGKRKLNETQIKKEALK